jgi:hypothetical protein
MASIAALSAATPPRTDDDYDPRVLANGFAVETVDSVN